MTTMRDLQHERPVDSGSLSLQEGVITVRWSRYAQDEDTLAWPMVIATTLKQPGKDALTFTRTIRIDAVHHARMKRDNFDKHMAGIAGGIVREEWARAGGAPLRLFALKLLPSSPAWVNPRDIVEGFVLAALTEDDARTMARLNAGDEGEGAWGDDKLTSCVDIGVANGIQQSGIVLRAFRPG